MARNSFSPASGSFSMPDKPSPERDGLSVVFMGKRTSLMTPSTLS